jgi:hypothetical protein
MREEPREPKTQSSGAMPPPRPPTRTAIGLAPGGDDDDSIRRRRKKETVKIDLPSKPVTIPTIKLPILPPSGPTTTPSLVPAKRWDAGSLVAGTVTKRSVRTNLFVSVALVFALQAVLLFEASASADRTIAILFLIVTFALAIPGYLWALEKNARTKRA